MFRPRPGHVCSWAGVMGLAMLTSGCGGSGTSNPPPVVSVSVSPGSAVVPLQAAQQFTATVAGTTNTAVIWEVGGVVGGNSALGTISSAGLYTAPATMPSAGTAAVTAVSQADGNKSASAQVTLTSGNLSVAVTPSRATVPLGCTQKFAATVSGPLNVTGVVWSVNGTEAGNSTVGSISASGLYIAPTAVPSPPTVTVAATSSLDTSQSGSASVTVAPASACLGSLSPIVAMQNTGALTLSVTGSGFTAGSQVMFNGSARTTSFVDSTHLTAALAAADVASPGVVPVLVQTDSSTSNSASFYVVPAIQAQAVAVIAGGESGNVNIGVPQRFPLSLMFLGIGIGNQAGQIGVQVTQGQSVSLFVVGNGVQPGTFYVISGNPADVTVTQPLVSDFSLTTNGFQSAHMQVAVSSSAALGPRSVLITNPAGEITVFPGALLVCNASGVCQ